MSNKVSDNLQSMFSKMDNFISTKTVVGDAVHFGDIILIPLVEVTFGVGTRLTEDNPNKEAGGGGLGARLTPVAVVVIINGAVQLVNVKNQESVNKLIDMIPGLLSKFNLDDLFSKKSKEESKNGDVKDGETYD
ncbi:MAG: sporulation protein [Defluviitaleaceae bacterium]|nr:sporulation protein [Defluviitaleaceae bacterium]